VVPAADTTAQRGIHIPMSDSLRAAFASPGDDPAEAYDHE
jgi:hypothetical protein